MQAVAKNTSRTKKSVPGILPVKKWLSLNEACCYMDMSVTLFQDLISKNGLSISTIGNKKYYRVAELENLIEEHILIKKVS